MSDQLQRNLSDLVAFQAARRGEQTFLVFEHQPQKSNDTGFVESMTYRQFDRRVNQTCRYLESLGVGHGDMVNLHLPNCPAFILLWFAIGRMGAVMMPTNVLGSAGEMEYLLDHSGSAISFTDQNHINVLETAARSVESLQQVVICPTGISEQENRFYAAINSFSAEPIACHVEATDLAAIMYTSGTTSKPKGVMVTHANYIKAGQTVADAVSITEKDRHFVVLPLFHGNAQYYSFMSALVCGASVALMDRFSASQYFDRCRFHGCTVASLFAAPMRMILAQAENALDRNNELRAVIFAQSLSPQQLADWDRRFNAPLSQLWGMTETMGPPLMNPWNGKRKNHTIGLPIGGYEIALVDSKNKSVMQGQQGEIIVKGLPGQTIMSGYFKNPEASRETIRDGWLYTGDNAVQDEEGYFVFVDRMKDMIKRSGENISAGEVESVIVKHPAVFECAVIGLPDELRDEKVVAVVVLKDGQQVEEEELIYYCKQRLASFRVPERVEFVLELPKTSVGKIQKHLLLQLPQFPAGD